MSSKGRGAFGRFVLVIAAVGTASAAAAAPILKLTGWDRGAVERAREGAVKRLAQPECQKLFDDFTDAQGRSLRQNLEEWTPSPAEYVGLVPFLDGSAQPGCRNSKVALSTSPGVRRVFVCKAFADYQLHQPGVAESMVIHEILHTLGLGEAPQHGAPTSIEITQRVEARCR